MTDIYYAGAGKPPTRRQKKLYGYLVTLCVRNGIEVKTGEPLKYMHNYWSAIDILKNRLRNAGVKWGEEIDHG